MPIVRFIPLIAWKNGVKNEVVVWHEVKDETEHLTHCRPNGMDEAGIELLSYRVAELQLLSC
ncbi:MAG: hypothetical protein ACLUOS_00060 [Odoribacter splanchnicus]